MRRFPVEAWVQGQWWDPYVVSERSQWFPE